MKKLCYLMWTLVGALYIFLTVWSCKEVAKWLKPEDTNERRRFKKKYSKVNTNR